ncbi:hypothetical protein ACSBR1_037274 [Camellia fascicularis]
MCLDSIGFFVELGYWTLSLCLVYQCLVGIYKRIMGQQCDLASRFALLYGTFIFYPIVDNLVHLTPFLLSPLLSGNLLSDDSWKEALSGVTSVISCVGGFGSNSCMYKINGTANINAIRAAAEKGVKRFVYISAADFGVVNYLLKGYYEGKVLQYAKPLNQVPLVGPLLTPPVNVTSVAKVAIRAATDPVFPPGIINVYGILRYSQQKST